MIDEATEQVSVVPGEEMNSFEVWVNVCLLWGKSCNNVRAGKGKVNLEWTRLDSFVLGYTPPNAIVSEAYYSPVSSSYQKLNIKETNVKVFDMSAKLTARVKVYFYPNTGGSKTFYKILPINATLNKAKYTFDIRVGKTKGTSKIEEFNFL